MKITKLNWELIFNLINNSRERIIYISPSMHEDLAGAIQTRFEKGGVEIKVCIDNQEKVYRTGYGSIDVVGILRKCNAELRQLSNLKLTILCIDKQCWSLHIESRIISADSEGPNALELPSDNIKIVMQTFFPTSEKNTETNKGQNELTSSEAPANISMGENLTNKVVKGDIDGLDVEPVSISEEFDVSKHEEVHTELKKNPPVEPDLQREINVYNTLFQFAELSFEGGNVTSKKISIPANSLPFRDVQLKKRMKTQYNLFTKAQTDKWSDLSKLKSDMEIIRASFLKPCSLRKDKNILLKSNKDSFMNEISNFEKSIESKKKSILDSLQESLNSSRDMLKTEWKTFFTVNPPDSVVDLREDLKEIQIDHEISKLLMRIKLPSAAELVKNFKVNKHFYELTWEDLADESLVNWFHESGLITEKGGSQIAIVNKAFDSKSKG